MMRFNETHQKKIQKKHWKKTRQERRQPSHPVVAATFSPFASHIASQIKNPGNSSVLDVGCGNGFLTFALAKHFKMVANLDFSKEMLQINPCGNKLQGSATDLPFADNSFDVVVASHLLHHLVEKDRLKSLQEMMRVSREMITIIEPNRNNPFMFLFSLLMKEERMALGFCRSYMQKLLEQLGLHSFTCQAEGWVVPNKAPVWWIPVGKFLSRTPIRRFGFDVFCIGHLDPKAKKANL